VIWAVPVRPVCPWTIPPRLKCQLYEMAARNARFRSPGGSLQAAVCAITMLIIKLMAPTSEPIGTGIVNNDF